MSTESEPQLSPAQLKNLSALADGTLDPGERQAVQVWIDSDPALGQLYERERQAVERLHAARAQDRAPEPLRARIEATRQAPTATARLRPSLGRVSLASGALAAAAAAIVIGLTVGGGTGVPSALAQAAALATQGPTQPAPAPSPNAPQVKLARDVQDIYFPNWTKFHWQATGARTDQLGSRQAVTVYYGLGRTQLAYTILGTGPLPQPSGQPLALNGYRLYTFTSGGRTIVTWRRDGHTCVLSATGVPAPIMQRLAAWRPSPVTE